MDEFRRFWLLFLGWSNLLHEGSVNPVCAGDDCERAAFFPGVQLSYVENLLRIDGDLLGERPALTSRSGFGRRERLTRQELRERVAGVAGALDELGVVPGDRIVAVAHNDANGRIHRFRRTLVGLLCTLVLSPSAKTVNGYPGMTCTLLRFNAGRPSPWGEADLG